MSTFRCRPPPRGIAERDLGAIAGFGVHRAFREIMGGSTRTDGETLRLGFYTRRYGTCWSDLAAALMPVQHPGHGDRHPSTAKSA
jgi:hypothetical protein